MTRIEFDEKLKDPVMCEQIYFALDIAFYHIGFKAAIVDLKKCNKNDVVEMLNYMIENKISCCGWEIN